MEIITKVISTQTIKPSSQTPKSLQKHQLSFLDQLAPPFFMSLVYFYSSNTKIPNSQKSYHLKKSLSETLSRFYPLAGRLVDNLYIDCNDRGAPFAEAEANCDLSRVITKPDPKNMHNFLPYQLINESQDLCMVVQATYFHCGGISVGLLISHKIADALSMVVFANTWSAVARKGRNGALPIPKFVAAFFPPTDFSGFKHNAGSTKEEISTRIFTFSAEKIAALQQMYSGVGLHRRPTRVEALSAYIWTRFITATGMKADLNKSYIVRHAVNLRTRANPPLSMYHFGNIFGLSAAKLTAEDGGVELMLKVHEAMEAVYDGYVAQLMRGDDKHMHEMNEVMAQVDKAELVSFVFTGICEFPLYEADFGWGKPVWIGSAGFPYKNLVIFMDTKYGNGIEALIHLNKQDMEKFEVDLEMSMIKSNL